MNPILETDRLLLREFNRGNSPFILSLLNSPGWLKYIGDRGVKSEEQAKDYLLNGPIKSYKENGFGLYLVEERISKLPIGLCGLLQRETLENPDLGFAFLSDYIGKGFAFEAANAVLEYTKSELRIPTILAIVLPDNQPSIKLLAKLGFQYRKSLQVKEGEDLRLYQVNL